jgi:hypothetical protein
MFTTMRFAADAMTLPVTVIASSNQSSGRRNLPESKDLGRGLLVGPSLIDMITTV